MKIMWLTNIALPEASLLMNEKPTPYGGWFVSMSTVLAEQNKIELLVAFPKNGLRNVLVLKGYKITYYAFPTVSSKKLSTNYAYLAEILDQARPDIVHVFGTEYVHTLAMVNVCQGKNIKVVIWIQGLTSIISRHYLAGLPIGVIYRFTLRDLLKQDNIKQQQSKFVKSGELEIEALEKVRHVVGRTTWDKACAYQINPDAQYYFCNETLRNEFYKHRWDIDRCEKHSIFVSQGSYPIKGLHFVIEAMPSIVKRFPDAKLYIGGQSPAKLDSLIDQIKISSYGKYINDLIGRFKLESNIVFTGILSEKEMCEQFLRSHVFVCPSSIENSPNSLGEAMILGVPCVASDVGGVSDLLTHNEEGFVYQSDAPYMLSHYVGEIFANDELAQSFSENAAGHAARTHDREEILRRMVQIYEEINLIKE